MCPDSAAARLRCLENGIGTSLLAGLGRLDKPPGAGQPAAARRRLCGAGRVRPSAPIRATLLGVGELAL
jgi:hypothetical protein